MTTGPSALDASDPRGIAAFAFYRPSEASAVDPRIVLALIEQAGEGMRGLESWQASIQVQATTLLCKVQEERATLSAKIADLARENTLLRRRLAETDDVVIAAMAERDDVFRRFEDAEIRAAKAAQTAASARNRAEIAEDSLVRLQRMIATEFSV